MIEESVLDEYINGGYSVLDQQQMGYEQVGGISREQLVIRVIAGGLTLTRDSNRARKNYSRYALTRREVLFNMPTVKMAEIR